MHWRASEHYASALEQFDGLKNDNGGSLHPDEQQSVERLNDKLAALSPSSDGARDASNTGSSAE